MIGSTIYTKLQSLSGTILDEDMIKLKVIINTSTAFLIQLKLIPEM